MKKWTAILAALSVMLIVSAPMRAAAASVPDAAQTADAPLQQHVRTWTDALSKQPAFSAWNGASRSISPLGPGTHGWLVTFAHDGKPVGYMIVNATPEGGYQLGEYGAGRHPAFDPDTMYNALIRQGLIGGYDEIAKKPLRLERLYFSPMLAAWKWTAASGETYYLDAWTGEALPIDEQAWLEQTKRPVPADFAGTPEISKLTAAKTNRTFDPFERLPWLTNAPLSAEQLKGLTGMLDKLAQVRYTAELFRSTVLYVLPAVGYHDWNDGRLYVAFEQSFPGTRYIPFEALSREGHFYK
ncbi:hypothetical protein [Paenibacillus glycinis]|uniref:Uncharacterized protein n=1 Tax=Paenibacillus glycinis TaxID=2697035 RepID=A0ABW9XUF0_9BACL|nr:hypothetical protein [Paenibacillus glycinis]NBD26304.1 hypothetical protein [Paenibacillus glycinis]